MERRSDKSGSRRLESDCRLPAVLASLERYASPSEHLPLGQETEAEEEVPARASPPPVAGERLSAYLRRIDR